MRRRLEIPRSPCHSSGSLRRAASSSGLKQPIRNRNKKEWTGTAETPPSFVFGLNGRAACLQAAERKKMMIKKILFYIVAVSMLSASAVEVANESALVTALSGADKNITITSSFTTTKNITIPEGYVVTLANGVTLTIGSYKGGLLNLTTYYYDISGAGVLVTKNYKVITDSTRTLPTVADSVNRFSGATYYVTKVLYSGGSVSRSVTCKQKTSVTVDDGDVNQVNFDPAAIVCKVSSGINGGREFYTAYSSFEEAYDAAKFQSSLTKVTDGTVVVLLRDGSFTFKKKEETKGVVIDCAGYSGKIISGLYDGLNFKRGEFANSSFVTFLNAKDAAAPKITNSGIAFINCENASVSEVNSNVSEQTHVYDCGTVNMKSGYPDTGGAYFYCGGPYNVSFSSNYKIYGGTFTSDPSAYVQGGFEAVQGSDGNWTVKKEVPKPNAASVGTVEYKTLQAAVDAAGSGEKITLLSDIEIIEPVTVAAGKTLTIELDKKDIRAEKGVFINNGVLKIEFSAHDDEPSTLSTASGDLIVNNGTLEITYGTFVGDVLLNAGKFIVHNGTFDGFVKVGDDVTDPKSVADIRGGLYKNTVERFLCDGFVQTLYSGYYYVGQFPYAILTSAAIDSCDVAWKIEAVKDEDRALYRKYKKISNLRKDFTDAEWYRCAELISMIAPYENDAIDCVITFSRTVKAESIKVSAGELSNTLKVDIPANQMYRAFSSNASVKDYYGFLTEENFSNAVFGMKNLSEENAGTVCTLEFQLCSSKKGEIIGTKHVLASASYRFPWKDAVPELREDDTPETVASALEGTVDARVAENIKDVASYNSYRQWTAGVKGATAADVKAAPNAWLSYALNTTNLVETPLEGDMSVASISPAAEDGVFKLSIAVKDIDIGAGNVSDEQMQENLAKVFGIEGSTSLYSNSFSRDNVVYTLGAPADGKVTVEARPAVASPTGCFFMRAKMTP